MQPSRLFLRLAGLLSILSLAAMACALPFSLPGSQPAETLPAETQPVEPGQATPAGPNAILTEVAAAMYTQAAAQQTTAAGAAATLMAQAPTSQPAQPKPTEAQPPAAPVKPSPTSAPPTAGPGAAPTTAPQPTVQPAPTQASSQPPSVPTDYIPPAPPAGFFAQPGQGFQVLGVNLPTCGENNAANFLIYNAAGQAYESASLQFSDLSSNENLYGPVTQDAPFFTDDHSCQPGGLERLEPGTALFIGSTLGSGGLTGQAVHAVLTLCTQNGMGGSCAQQTVDFVIP